MPAPIVLITCDRREAAAPSSAPAPGTRVRPGRSEVVLKESLVQAVRAAGGLPLLLPPGALSDEELGRLLALAQAVVVSGGAFDIHPSHYGRETRARLDRVDEARTGLELPLCRWAMERGIPLLGVCGGMQAMAVAAGGTLVQDVGSEHTGALEHEQPTDPATPWHEVELEGALAAAMGGRIRVNSTHHQAVEDPGALRIVGRSPDGVVEAIEGQGPAFALGVQWHPELLDVAGQAPFRMLIQAAQKP